MPAELDRTASDFALNELKAKTEKYRKKMIDVLNDIDATIEEINTNLSEAAKVD